MAGKLVRVTLIELVDNLINHVAEGFGDCEVMAIGTTSEGEFSFLLKSKVTGKEYRYDIPYMNFIMER